MTGLYQRETLQRMLPSPSQLLTADSAGQFNRADPAINVITFRIPDLVAWSYGYQATL